MVSEFWINESTDVQTTTNNGSVSSGGYGYYWWLGKHNGHLLKAAFGHGGQFIYIIEDLDLVMVATCNGKVSDDVATNHFLTVQSTILNEVIPIFETEQENKTKVAIYSGAGADSYLQAAAQKMFESMNFDTYRVDANAINSGDFGEASILYFAGG